jgi:hypothetical protein
MRTTLQHQQDPAKKRTRWPQQDLQGPRVLRRALSQNVSYQPHEMVEYDGMGRGAKARQWSGWNGVRSTIAALARDPALLSAPYFFFNFPLVFLPVSIPTQLRQQLRIKLIGAAAARESREKTRRKKKR